MDCVCYRVAQRLCARKCINAVQVGHENGLVLMWVVVADAVQRQMVTSFTQSATDLPEANKPCMAA